MKKTLYFYIWISPDFETNIAVMVHEICLKRYIRIFDEINFIVAVDDIGDAWRAVKWANSVCGEQKYNIRIVDNAKIRESRVVIEDLLPKIIKRDNEIVFFGHSKAITDVSMNHRNKFSVLRWVISMYYYCFEYLYEAERKLSNNSMYGSLLTHFSMEPNSLYKTHNTFYIGNFFWLNPSNCAKNSLFETIIPNEYDRFLAENMPLLFNSKTLSSHNMAITENTVADLYHLRKEEWPKYLSYYGDSDILFKMQNEIIKEVCGEEGY